MKDETLNHLHCFSISMKNPRAILFVQRILPHYRLPFFDLLGEHLLARGYELHVMYGLHRDGSVPKSVDTNAAWGRRTRTLYFDVFGREFVLHAPQALVTNATLTIVEQANRLLLNYVLLGQRAMTKRKVAFWGHGKNYQASSDSSLAERLKRSYSTFADWWFAYNEASAATVSAAGFDERRITVVNNAIDTSEIDAAVRDPRICVRPALLDELGPHACLYCGGVYPDKRISFLLDAAIQVRETVSDFQLVIIGEGPDSALVERAARDYPWIHHLGPVFGSGRVPYLLCCKAMLMPAQVGLATIDSFSSGTPMITTAADNHSPEYSYLVDGWNAVVTEPQICSYARGIVEFLLDEERQRTLSDGCRRTSQQLTVDNMAENFAHGIFACLDGVESSAC